MLRLRLYASWALEKPSGWQGRHFGRVFGILSVIYEKPKVL
jgi:hypothetical protein